MRIIGIDPGTIVTGYGIIDFDGYQLDYVYSGIINLKGITPLSQKLAEIYNSLEKLIKKFRPEEISIESAFYGKNVQSAMKIGYARGMALLLSARYGMNPGEYSPREIKKSVVGKGNASKEQVRFMVSRLLSVDVDQMIFDETDALSVAICHAFNLKRKLKKNSNWKDFVKNNPDRIIE